MKGFMIKIFKIEEINLSKNANKVLQKNMIKIKIEKYIYYFVIYLII